MKLLILILAIALLIAIMMTPKGDTRGKKETGDLLRTGKKPVEGETVQGRKGRSS